MPKLSPITSRDLIRILQKQDFISVRQKGSHVRMEHADGRKTSVHVGLLRKILRDVQIAPETFHDLR